MKIHICPLCVIVSGTWLMLSIGVAWGYLSIALYGLPIALLMGGTVVGIAYQGERRLHWASRNNLLWKTVIVALGMPIAYMFVTHLSKSVVGIELVLLLVIAYFFFVKRPMRSRGSVSNTRISDIEEKMEHCC